MKQLLALGLLFVIAVGTLTAAEATGGYAPTPTAVTYTTASARITYVRLVNNGGGTSAKCTILDRTTACGGAGCPVGVYQFTADPAIITDVIPLGAFANTGFTFACTTSFIAFDILYQKSNP